MLKLSNPDLARHEYSKWTGPGRKLRSEESVQGAEVGAHRCRGEAIRERAGVVLLEVISHLRFQLDTGVQIEGRVHRDPGSC